MTCVHSKQLAFFLLHVHLIKFVNGVASCWNHSSPIAWSTTQEQQWRSFCELLQKKNPQENKTQYYLSFSLITATSTHSGIEWYTTNWLEMESKFSWAVLQFCTQHPIRLPTLVLFGLHCSWMISVSYGSCIYLGIFIPKLFLKKKPCNLA